MPKIALITGVTGQDGSLLCDFLIKKKYKVIGIKRRSSSFNTQRINHFYDKQEYLKVFMPVYGDMTDSNSITNIIQKYKPDEIYNLAAQSHVRTSFETPEYTSNVDALGTLRILESIRLLGLQKKTKFYQASTSEIFGNTEIPQNERTAFKPTSPYAISKLYAYWTTVNYRNAYKIFATNGILFNHEGTRRGETFVSRKITRGVAKIFYEKKGFITLGNLDSKRDWGNAKDYIESMWLMLQAKKADDFVIATGKSFSVRTFVEEAFKNVDITIKWSGQGLKEIGYDKKTKKILVKINPIYFRPTEVYELRGDYSKAKRILKWRPKTNFKTLVKEMVTNDLNNYKNNKID
jgi:GDPmannose 4,6-dehydratase